MLLTILQGTGQPQVRAQLGDRQFWAAGGLSGQSPWLITPYFHVTGLKNMEKNKKSSLE